MTAKEIKGEIIDFEFEKLSRQEKELEKLRKNSNVKKIAC